VPSALLVQNVMISALLTVWNLSALLVIGESLCLMVLMVLSVTL
jgi:hypothetical protein